MHGYIGTVMLFASLLLAASANAGGGTKVPSGETVEETVQATLRSVPAGKRAPEGIRWVRNAERRDAVSAPTKLAIIACRVEAEPDKPGSRTTSPDWRVPVECMRVIETVTDAASSNHLWLRQVTPNLGDGGTCAEVAMNYAPIWEASHRNWLIVKVGCPTKIVDADGRIVGWHMPECQGTLPGTTYPLRCRFDPSEI